LERKPHEVNKHRQFRLLSLWSRENDPDEEGGFSITHQNIPAGPLQTLAGTLQDWIEPIACMWRTTRNNGITEGFHRKMKLIQRRAYGFRNFENYRLRVIAQCG
jgi:hypothetical protein